MAVNVLAKSGGNQTDWAKIIHGQTFPIAVGRFSVKMSEAVAENQPTNKNRDER
jgi:hypothetical protein